MGNLIRSGLVGVCLALVMLAASPASAATPKAVVSDTVYSSAAVLAAEKRVADEQLRRQRREIDALKSKLAAEKAAGVRRAAADEERLREMQDRYVTRLSEKDAEGAQAISAFRAAAEELASTPEGVAILAERKPGSLGEARKLLLALVEDRRRKADREADIQQARDLRSVAVIAIDDRRRGEATFADVIDIYEKVVALDPSRSEDWAQLSRLYLVTNDFEKAAAAASTAERTALSDEAKSSALIALGDVLVRQNKAEEARKIFQQGLAIDRRLEKAAPGTRLREVSIDLDRIGDLLVRMGDISAAKTAYEESLAIRRRLAEAAPTAPGPRRDVSISLLKVGDVLLTTGDRTGAEAAYVESLDIRRRLSAEDPASVDMQREVAVSLAMVAGRRKDGGDPAGARKAYEESLVVFRRLSAADPGSATLRKDVAVTQLKLGELLLGDDPKGALVAFEESLRIFRDMSAANPTSAELKLLVAASFDRVGDSHFDLGDMDTARRAYEEGITIRRALVIENPGSAESFLFEKVHLEKG